jgi:murein endopeptidase
LREHGGPGNTAVVPVTEPPSKPTIHKGSVGDDDFDDLPPAEASADDEPSPEPDDEPESEDEDEADDAAPDRTHVRHHPRGRMRIAPVLFAGAAALWGGAMALRCRPTPPVPTAAVPTGEVPTEPAIDTSPPRAEPADAPALEGAPAEPRVDAEADAEALPDGGEPPEPPTGGDRLPQRKDDWAAGLELPTKVRYTIRRGGSLKNVANLFKIFHHEILELNPGIGLEQELPPNSRVVVYSRKEGTKSESIGYPSDGELAGAVPMVEGPGRRILAIGWKTWGKDTSIAMLDHVLDQWAKRGNVQDILVGNIANRTGGRLEPHSTHQSGRDVDLGYPQKLAPGAELNWQEMTAANLDAAETWELLFLLGDSGAVEEIYIDREIQKLLHKHALESELLSKGALAKWMEYPRPTGTQGVLITHVPGHTDHMHVRWSCVRGDSRCKSR